MGRGTLGAAGGIEVITADEVAAMLGIGRNAVYEAAKRGEIPHRRVGRRVIFERGAIEEWLRGAPAVYRDGPKCVSPLTKERRE